MTTEISTIDPIRNALANAESIEDLRGVRDMASAAKAWAKSRGLGIEAENEAAEYILRAERGIGEHLLSLGRRGLYGRAVGAARQGVATPVLVEALTGDRTGKTPQQLADMVGLDVQQVTNALAKVRYFKSNGPSRSQKQRNGKAPHLWVLDPDEEYVGFSTVTRDELGLSAWESEGFQKLASLTDEQFEAMLRAAHESRQRIAKVNFYQVPRRPGERAATPTAEDPGFDAFRRGAYNLLGWRINEDGYGEVTKNGLILLPDDELKVVHDIIVDMAAAYTQAVEQRRA